MLVGGPGLACGGTPPARASEASSCDLKELVQKFIPEAIGREIEKATRSIYPLQNVYVRKAKILKAPKFDMSKLLELHGESTDVSILIHLIQIIS